MKSPDYASGPRFAHSAGQKCSSALLELGARFFPAINARSVVLHVRVPELLRGGGGGEIGGTVFIATVRDNQRVLVPGQQLREFFLLRDVIDGAGNPAFLERLGAVHIQERHFSGRDRGLEFLVGNRRELGRRRQDDSGQTEREEQCSQKFHGR